jgi:tetratricopeptide (TPR) repeat protein
MPTHLHVVGARAGDRRPHLDRVEGPAVFATCEKGLRGPYTGVDTAMAAVLPDAHRRWPELVDYHRLEILEGMPELSDIIGPAPRTLANEATFGERTRWFEASMVRVLSQGVITFLREYAKRLRAQGLAPPTLVFDAVHRADPTAQEFIELFVRRIDAEVWPVVVGSNGDVNPALAAQLGRRASRVEAEPLADTESAPRDPARLAADYVESDGTSEDPAAYAAYQALDPAERAVLHDRRADALEPGASWGVKSTALPYHRERGTDPQGAGVRALMDAIEYCTSVGFSAMAVDLGERGRALVDPEADFTTFRRFTHILITHVIAVRRLDEAMALCHEMRRRSMEPTVHMTTSYYIAMIHTRFAVPRNHELAMEWQNNAIAVADALPSKRDRLVLGGFQENGLALIEMHRGNLPRALTLVEGALTRLEKDLDLRPDEWALHRSQLVYNRARLLSALGRTDEAYDEFTKLIGMDPCYTDYFSERAKISRRRGDLEAAVADYTRAAELGQPFVELYHNRGSAYVELGLYQEALADFDYVLDMEPDDADTLLSRAELLLGTGEPTGAARDVARGLDLLPGDPRLLCLRGLIRLAEGDAAAALPDFDAALARDADYPAALINRAVALYEVDQPHRSALDLTRALELSGDDPDLLLNRGIAYTACGESAAALADFELALTLPGADRIEALYRRGSCLIGIGDRARGEADLRECRRLGGHTDEVDGLLAHT